MNKNHIRYIAIISGIILVLVLLFGLRPSVMRFFKTVMTKGEVENKTSFQLEQEENLQELLSASRDLQTESFQLPFKLLGEDEKLDVIRIFEDIANVSGNEIEIATRECEIPKEGEEEKDDSGLCFSLSTIGSFTGLLSFNENLSNMPFAHNVETVNTVYQKKKGTYNSVFFVRVYTALDVR